MHNSQCIMHNCLSLNFSLKYYDTFNLTNYSLYKMRRGSHYMTAPPGIITLYYAYFTTTLAFLSPALTT